MSGVFFEAFDDDDDMDGLYDEAPLGATRPKRNGAHSESLPFRVQFAGR